MQDPRFLTQYSDNSQGPFFFRQNTFLLPASTQEVWAECGYQKKREPKGFDLTVNDYSRDRINYGGPQWDQVVHTPFKTYN
jgi:hypothetical protein